MAETPATYKGKTADQWREDARAQSSGVTAQHRLLCAELAESSGLIEVPALFDLTGTLVPALHGWGQYGEYWAVLNTFGDKTGERFIPSKALDDGRARANDARKGYYVGTALVPGKATVVDAETGPGGTTACYAAKVPVHGAKITPGIVAGVVDNGH